MTRWTAQQLEREWERRASSYVSTLMTEPEPEAVDRLAALADQDAALAAAPARPRYSRRLGRFSVRS